MERNEDALAAYQKAVALRQDDAGLLVDYADALAVKNQHSLQGEPMTLITKALKLNPDHLKGLALDVNSKGAAGLNALAGPRTSPTGWLESYGLSRPVANEDWHIQPTGLVGTGDAPIVANKTGEAVDASKGTKDTKLTAEASAPTSGSAVSQASNDVAVGQRQQSKPSAPIIVKNTTINNNNSTNTQLAGAPKDNTSTNGALLARAT
jgi:hypothetical protein